MLDAFLEQARLTFEDEKIDKDGDGFISKEEAYQYYVELGRNIYGKEHSLAEFEEMWKKEHLILNEFGKIDKQSLVAASGHEWKSLTAQLQDLQITIFEVDETFPTMYFMQKIIKKKITFIYGVEKEMLTWN